MSDIATDGNEVRCAKCGVEITTGLMAAFCPLFRECEFYVPELDEFIEGWEPPFPNATREPA